MRRRVAAAAGTGAAVGAPVSGSVSRAQCAWSSRGASAVRVICVMWSHQHQHQQCAVMVSQALAMSSGRCSRPPMASRSTTLPSSLVWIRKMRPLHNQHAHAHAHTHTHTHTHTQQFGDCDQTIVIVATAHSFTTGGVRDAAKGKGQGSSRCVCVCERERERGGGRVRGSVGEP